MTPSHRLRLLLLPPWPRCAAPPRRRGAARPRAPATCPGEVVVRYERSADRAARAAVQRADRRRRAARVRAAHPRAEDPRRPDASPRRCASCAPGPRSPPRRRTRSPARARSSRADPGNAGVPGGWQQIQWNFLAEHRRQRARRLAAADRRRPPRRRGRDRRGARHGRRLQRPRALPALGRVDLAAHDHLPPLAGLPRAATSWRATTSSTTTRGPNDENGHGTHVVGHDRRGHRTTTSASPASPTARGSCPCACSTGSARATASRSRAGIRFAARNGADVINLSFEFGTAGDPRRDPGHPRRAALRAPQGRARGRRLRQRGRAQRRLPGARLAGAVGRRDHPARLRGRVLQQRRQPRHRRPRRRRGRPRSPATPTAGPTSGPAATSSR